MFSWHWWGAQYLCLCLHPCSPYHLVVFKSNRILEELFHNHVWNPRDWKHTLFIHCHFGSCLVLSWVKTTTVLSFAHLLACRCIILQWTPFGRSTGNIKFSLRGSTKKYYTKWQPFFHIVVKGLQFVLSSIIQYSVKHQNILSIYANCMLGMLWYIFIYKSKLIWDEMLFIHWLYLFLVISLKKQIYSYKKIQNTVYYSFIQHWLK